MTPEREVNLHGIAKAIEREHRRLWTMCYPKSYTQVSHWTSPRAISAMLGNEALNWACSRDKQKLEMCFAEMAPFAISNEIVRCGVPMFFLPPDLTEAVKQTDPPLTITPMDMKLPFSAGVFLFPTGSTMGEDWVAYARFPHIPEDWESNQLHYFGVTPMYVADGEGTFAIWTGTKGPSTLHYSFPRFSYPTLDLANLRDIMGTSVDGPSSTPDLLTMEDREVLHEAAHLLFGTLLIMESRPEYVEAGRKKALTIKQGAPLWTPNIIGRDYRIKRSPSDPESGSGIAKRAHWRRGHWRDQAYGPAFSLRKHIWLEPTWVAGVE